jgi:hypothetical protein
MIERINFQRMEKYSFIACLRFDANGIFFETSQQKKYWTVILLFQTGAD